MNTRFSQGQRIWIWLVFTAILPVIFVVAAWLIQAYILSTADAFVETFGTGDLIPLAALLILSVYADIRLNDMSSELLTHELIFFVAMVLAVLAYGAIKTHGIEKLRANDDVPLWTYAKVSWWAMAYAVAHTTYVKFRIEQALYDDA